MYVNVVSATIPLSAANIRQGGVNLEIKSFATTLACDSVAKYAEISEHIFQAANGTEMDSIVAEKHISSMSGRYKQVMPNKTLEKSRS